MGHWPEHLLNTAEFSSIALVLLRQGLVKRDLGATGKRVRAPILLQRR
jgi:hypothetical protein